MIERAEEECLGRGWVGFYRQQGGFIGGTTLITLRLWRSATEVVSGVFNRQVAVILSMDFKSVNYIKCSKKFM